MVEVSVSGAARSRRGGVALVLGALAVAGLSPEPAAAQITIKFNAGYNLVVDSNACSPPTYAPDVATNGVAFCNYTSTRLTDVVAYIGDATTGTPGVYPTRDSSTAANDVCAESPCLCDSGEYSLTHLGDTVDAIRYIGDLEVGECSWQYWSFTYPSLRNGQAPGSGCDSPVWCDTNNPMDDLWLTYDVWAVSAEGPTGEATRRVTMRNEISASANKIYPNGGQWFSQPDTCQPGQFVTTNGINYELGVVNQGFDNDADGQADYNGWLQPIGSADWNPACFRLVRTSGQLDISRPGSPNELLDFENQLYFTEVPDNTAPNSGITGTVFYQFMCLGGACAVPLTPYQEAASGQDNEKFAGDFGGGPGLTLKVSSPEVDGDKQVSDASADGVAQDGEILTYTIDLSNTGTEALGQPAFNSPLVIRDAIPAGTSYVAGSAAENLACCTTKILFSPDGGVSWSSTEPTPASSVTNIQWRLEQQFPSGATGDVSFDVQVDSPYLGDPVILNTAQFAFGDAAAFAEYTAGIPTEGPNSIGDTVFADDGGSSGFLAAEALNGVQDGGVSEAGIASITLTLYWDRNGDGELDAGDVPVRTTSTDGSGNYSFGSVPDGDWLVVVDVDDADLPTGYRITEPTGSDRPRPEIVVVNDLGVGTTSGVSFLDADFGFGPSLVVDKALSQASQCGENNRVTWELTARNTRPADTPCGYTFWAESAVSGSWKHWTNEPGALGADGPDGNFAEDDFNGATDRIRVTGFTAPAAPGNITRVEALFWVYLDGPVSNDTGDLELFESGTQILGHTFPINPECNDGIDNDGDGQIDLADAQCTSATFGSEDGLVSEAMNTLQPTSAQGALVAWDVTAAAVTGGWDFGDFANLELAIFVQKQGALDGRIIFADALGFRVSTDRLCGEPGDDMSTVALEDQFDIGSPPGATFVASRDCGLDTDADGRVCGDADDSFLFPNSQTTCTGVTATCLYGSTGVLRWSDIGPLLAGESRTISVTVSVPDGTAGSTLADTAMSCGTAGGCQNTYFDGALANDHQDAASCVLAVTSTIGDRVWNDVNGNGVDDAEAGIPNVTLRLYRDLDSDGVFSAGDALLATTVTDATGAYLFPGLIDGDYVVVVDSGTIPDSAPNQTFDRDGTLDHQTGVTLAGSDVLDADFGYDVPNFVFGTVFYDFDADGTRDAIDYGLGDGASFVSVQLWDCGTGTCGDGDETQVAAVFTDAAGNYAFPNLANGNYQVRVDTASLAGLSQTADPDEAGLCATCDSRAVTGGLISLTGGTTAGSYDFGYTQPNPTSTIGDTLYRDWNGNGAEDTGDTGIAGITVYLYRDDGDGVFDPSRDVLSGTEITDSNGNYLFDRVIDCGAVCEVSDPVLEPTGLPAGNWFVWVDEGDPDLPSGFSQTGDPDEAGTCSACDAVGASTTNGVDDDLTVDFGYSPGGFAAIGDRVWNDADADGIQDAGEVGIGNITVSLYVDSDGDGVLNPASDALVATTVTDADGTYLFENLFGDPSILYFVDVDTGDPDLPTDGGDDFDVSTTADNNPYVLTSTCAVSGTCTGSDPIEVTLTSNTQTFLGADFGFGPGGVIGDLVFEDVNGDGTQTATSEPGIGGVTVTLLDCGADGVCGNGDDGGTQTKVTDANGNYIFTGLPAGTYQVTVDTGTLPSASYSQTFDPDESAPACTVCDSQMTVTLFTGQRIMFADFGYQPPFAIGDLIWSDEDGQGDFDVTEAGIAGVTVNLTGPGCAPCTTTTDADGLYFFRNLVAGDYTVTVDTSTLPGGAAAWQPTYDPDEAPTCTTCDGSSTFTMDADGIIGSGTDLSVNFLYDFGYVRNPAPEVTIDKDTTTPTASAGGQVTFTIVARNAGNAVAELVRIHDDVSAWGSPGSCTGGNCLTLAAFSITESNATRTSTVNPAIGATNLTWSAWTIQPGGSVTVSYTLDVDAGTANGTYDNTADGGYDSDSDGIEDTTFDDDGLLAQDADTPPAMDPESDEDVTLTALPILDLSKTCSLASDPLGNGFVDPDDVLQYDIVVTNSGTAPATIFALSDGVPNGTTYVAASSTLVSYPDWRDEITFADDFEAGSSNPPRTDDNAYPDGDDTTPSTSGWSGVWTTGGATTQSDLGDLSLLVGKNDAPTRTAPANLYLDPIGCPTCTGGEATLTFSYRRVLFDTADTLDVEVCGSVALTINGSSDGGSGSDFTDSGYVTRTIDVTSLLPTAAATDTCTIQFDANAYDDAAGEGIFVDDVSLTRRLRYTLGPDPGDDPALLVPAADDRVLLVGESMTVRFQSSANDPLPLGLSQVSNTAYAQAAEVTTSVSDSCAIPVNPALIPTGSIAGTVWADGTAPAQDGVKDSPAAEGRMQNIRVELSDGVCTVGVSCPVTLTDVNGDYLFSNLPAGTFTVVIDEVLTLPVGRAQSGDPDEVGVCTTCDAQSAVTLTTGENRTGVDFGYYVTQTVLPVTLASFSAVAEGSSVMFSWTTETETRNAGFHIYGQVNGEWQLLNEHLIPSRVVDSVTPQDYGWLASGVVADTFLLADVDTRGKARFHGPFHLGDSLGVERRAGNRRPIAWKALRDEHRERGRQRRNGWRRRQQPEVRLEVERDGLYRVTWEQLMDAGLDLTGVPLSHLALLDRDGPVPVLVEGQGRFGAGDAIVFFGHGTDSLYTAANLYTLRVDIRSALRIPQSHDRVRRGAAPATTYRETVRTAADNWYSYGSLNGDPWYDQLLIGYSGPVSTSVQLTLDEYAPEAGRPEVDVETWGYNDWPQEPDHHLAVAVNGVGVADDRFDGRVVHAVRAELPRGAVREGVNSVNLTLPFDVGVPWDIVALESTAITYPRRLVARDAHLVFDSEAEALTVSGLPAGPVTVLRVAGDRIEQLTRLDFGGGPSPAGRGGRTPAPSPGYEVTFAGLGAPATYLVAGAGGFLTPGVSAAPPHEPLPQGPAEYLIVSHPDFIDGLEPLVSDRSKRFTVQVVDVEDIYAAYSGGMPDPRAIHEYVKHSIRENGTRYVLLVGGDTYDYKDVMGLGSVSFVPSLYVPTSSEVLFTPADPLYGDTDGDGVPEIPVGRLPVRSAAELDAALAKTLAYEGKTYGRTLLAVSDAYDRSNRFSFLQASRELTGALDPTWHVEPADVDVLGASAARQKLLSTLNQGVALTQFFGHSGPMVWGNAGLLRNTDGPKLQNQGRPAVIAQWGCWNTYYVFPLFDTMGHSLMLSGEQGAAAVLGSSSLATAESDLALGQLFLPKVTAPGVAIGDALVEAKRELALHDPSLRDVIIGWTLLGDPALVVNEGAGVSP